MVNRLEKKQSINQGRRTVRLPYRSRSTECAWRSFQEYVSGTTAAYVLGLFANLKSAFDIKLGGMFEKLHEVECREINLWMNYFSNRKTCVKGAKGEVSKYVERGCPQGLICGPFIYEASLWTIYCPSL